MDSMLNFKLVDIVLLKGNRVIIIYYRYRVGIINVWECNYLIIRENWKKW